MSDIFSQKKRSFIMSKIRSKDTKIENLFAKKMLANKIKFKQHPNLFGKPDFLIDNSKIIVFIDGCFWHMCPKHFKSPKTRKNFWIPKIKNNVARDRIVNRKLKKMGYGVLRFWEHEIENKPDLAVKKLLRNM